MAVVHASGHDGSITGPGFAAVANEWELTIEREVHEYSVFGDEWKSSVRGRKNPTGTLNFVLDTNSATYETEFPQADAGTEIVALVLKTDSTGQWGGNVNLTNLRTKCSVDGVIEGSANFVGADSAGFTWTASS